MIIFINGSINAGKSTVSKILADKLGSAALLEVDCLRDFIGWMTLEKSIPINLENAVSLIQNFHRRGIDVVVPYPLSKENYNFLMQELHDFAGDIKVFTLAPTLEVASSNRGRRELTEQERARIKHHYAIGIPTPNFGTIIDNSNETPEETANKILKLLSK
ncbi:MAG: hypothetical protein WCJ29_04500 [bacterium]